jgi:filamentous hemagglutinin
MVGLQENSYLLRLSRALLAYFLSFLLIFQPFVSYADGGIVVDGAAPASQRAGLDAAQNGVPVVNITAPSAGGVSRNSFTDFNVDSRGVIMNNSLVVGVSQLGGALPGNANFTGGRTASIILNEVTSTNRSNISGATEIFGDRAQYVLVNPNGITCSGCGFINTPRVTLSTGAADVSGGNLNGFNVTGGDVRFEGLDVNATGLDSFDIISRTASFAASVYAGSELNVITGSNHVDYNTKAATPIAGSGAAPQVGVDSSALGGMYAGKINLVATEAGVGVNTQGTLGASSGDIKITADGRIEFKDANAKGKIKVTSNSASVKHSGNSYSEGNTEITAAGAVELADGFTASKGDVKINSAILDENSAASLMAGVDAIVSGADVTFNDNGIGALNITTSGIVNNAGLLTGASITANSGSFNNTGLVQSVGDITIISGSIANNNNYVLDSNGNIAGGINSRGKLTLTSTSGNIDNTDGAVTSTGLFTITSSGSLINNSLISGSGAISINAANVDNSDSYFTDINGYLIGGIIAGGSLGITTSGVVNNTSGAISANSLNISSTGSLTNDSGLISSATAINSTSVGVSNNSGAIYANNAVNINAGNGNFSNTSGVINTAGNIDINHAAAFSNTGLISGSGVGVSAYSIDNSNSYNTNSSGVLTTGILSNGDVTLTASNGAILNNSGAVFGHNLALTSTGQLNNTAGLLQATNTANITAFGINNSSTFVKNSSGTLVKGIITASDLTIAAGSGDIDNTSGAIKSSGKITATNTAALTNTGLIQSTGDTNITSASLANSNNLHTESNGNLDKGILSGGKLDINTSGDAANSGALYSDGKLTVTSGGNVVSTGLVAAGDDIGVTAAVVSNSGSIITDYNIALKANTGNLSNAGGYISGNNIGITANNGNFDNSGGLSQSAGTTTINSKGLINDNTYVFDSSNNLAAGIISGGDLTATTGTGGFSNSNGAIYSQGAATITSSGNFNNTGLVKSINDLSVTAANIDNSNSVGLISNQDITLSASAGTIKNIAGYIAARNITATSTGKFDNTGGTLRSTINARINANGIDNSDTYITDNSGNIISGIIAGGTITLLANTGDIISSNGAIIGSGNIILTADGKIQNSGLIQGSHDITANAGNIDNSDSYFTDNNGTLIGGILAGGNANLTANNGDIIMVI